MPTAAECRAQAIEMIGACETVDSFHRDIGNLGKCGLKYGPYVESVGKALEQEESTLRALSAICNQLSEELFHREKLCQWYTAEMQRYRRELAVWVEARRDHQRDPITNPDPGSAPPVPPPPFPGAQEG